MIARLMLEYVFKVKDNFGDDANANNNKEKSEKKYKDVMPVHDYEI